MDGKGPLKRTMKACIESAGWKRRNGWYPHCKHSVLISKTHFGENPKPLETENGTIYLES